MKSEDWMPTLDKIAGQLGYEAAALTEAVVIALLSAGVDREDIEVNGPTKADANVYVTITSYDAAKHGRSRMSTGVHGSLTIPADDPVVRHLRPHADGDHQIGAAVEADTVCGYTNPLHKGICMLKSHDKTGCHVLEPQKLYCRYTDSEGGRMCSLRVHGPEIEHSMALRM